MPNRDHEQAQEISSAAAILLAQGRHVDARAQFSIAADLELSALGQVSTDDKPRTWGILAVSAVSLLYKAHRYDQAENLIYSYLTVRLVPDQARRQLRELLEVIWDEQSLPHGFEYSGDEFLVTLRGGEVGSGTAPLDLVIEKNAEVRGLATRVLEWKARRPFRVSGPPDALVADRVQARVTQPTAGSYRFLIRLVAPAQTPLFPDAPTVDIHGVADSIFTIVRHACTGRAGAEDLKRLVPDDQYRSTMLKLVRNIVPTGRHVGEVEIARVTRTTPDAEPVRTSVLLTKDSRGPVAEAIKAGSSEQSDEHFETIKGTLRAVHLDQDWLVIVQDDGTGVRCEGAGSNVDDVLGPLVNRRVIVRAQRRPISRKLRLIDIEADPDAG